MISTIDPVRSMAFGGRRGFLGTTDDAFASGLHTRSSRASRFARVPGVGGMNRVTMHGLFVTCKASHDPFVGPGFCVCGCVLLWGGSVNIFHAMMEHCIHCEGFNKSFSRTL